MRTWRYMGVHRLTWVVLALLVVAVAVFAMAAGFSRLRTQNVPSGNGPEAVETGSLGLRPDITSTPACAQGTGVGGAPECPEPA